MPPNNTRIMIKNQDLYQATDTDYIIVYAPLFYLVESNTNETINSVPQCSHTLTLKLHFFIFFIHFSIVEW